MSVAATVNPKHNVTGNRQAYYDKISKKDMAPLWEVLRRRRHQGAEVEVRSERSGSSTTSRG